MLMISILLIAFGVIFVASGDVVNSGKELSLKTSESIAAVVFIVVGAILTMGGVVLVVRTLFAMDMTQIPTL